MFGNTVNLELIGGSRDGELVEAKEAPDFLKVKVGKEWSEIYERQNDAPPFVYVQIGYVAEEQWK